MKEKDAQFEFCGAACPLCTGRQQVTSMDSFLVEDVCLEYRRQLGIDVRKEFPLGVERLELCICSHCGMQYTSPLVSGSPEFYAALGGQEYYYARSRWEFGRALALIERDERVLDVGCGDGYFLSLLPPGSGFGLEWNPAAIQAASNQGLDVRCGKLESVADSSVDVITLFQVLEHVTNPVALLRDTARILRPGGRLFVAVPNNDGFLGEGLHEPLNTPPHHPLRWTKAALEFVPEVVPFRLEAMEEEPLARDHIFQYRKWRLIRCMQGVTGWKLRRMSLDPASVFIRKCAHALVFVCMKWSTALPRRGALGHSILAVYRR